MPNTSSNENDLDGQTVVRVESKLREFYDTLAPDEQVVVDTLLARAFDSDAEVAGYAVHPLVSKGWTFYPSSATFHVGLVPPDPIVGGLPPDPVLPNPGQ